MLLRNFGHDERKDADADKLAMEVWQNYDQYSFDCERREPEELIDQLDFYEIVGFKHLDPNSKENLERKF